MKADAILMHREKQIIAVRAKPADKSIIQVSDAPINFYQRSLTWPVVRRLSSSARSLTR